MSCKYFIYAYIKFVCDEKIFKKLLSYSKITKIFKKTFKIVTDDCSINIKFISYIIRFYLLDQAYKLSFKFQRIFQVKDFTLLHSNDIRHFHSCISKHSKIMVVFLTLVAVYSKIKLIFGD